MATNVVRANHMDRFGETGFKKGSKQPRFFLEPPARMGVGRFDANGRWTSATPSFCRMLGYARRDLMKKTINETTHPDDRPLQKGRLEKMMGGKKGAYTVEKRYICRNGLPLWVIETISVERDNAGSFLYGMVVVEVNDRKCAQGLFQLMLESSREAMAVLDERGNVVLVNSAAERIFGYQHSELFGKKIDLLLPDLPPTGTRSSFARLPVGLRQGRSDSHGLRKDGTFFPAKVEVQTIEMGRGGWNITSIADLSEYKQPEEEGVSHAFQHKFGAQWQAGRPFFAAAGSELSQLHSRPAP